jgi:hypothetical protein
VLEEVVTADRVYREIRQVLEFRQSVTLQSVAVVVVVVLLPTAEVTVSQAAQAVVVVQVALDQGLAVY